MLSNGERRRALRAFKQRGIVVHVGALENLHAAYQNVETGTFEDFLDKSFDLLSRSDGAVDGILTKALAQQIGTRLQKDILRNDGHISATLEVIDTFSVPKWKPTSKSSRISSINSQSILETPIKPIIDGTADMKNDLFRLRYEFILNKTLRNKRFRAPTCTINNKSNKKDYYQLTGIESLSSGAQADDDDVRNMGEEKLVLGMLTQLEEGTWFLEDLNGTTKLDLSQADITAGLHTDGSFVIVQGALLEQDGTDPIFIVSAMGTPPHETREDSIETLGKESNLFGGHYDHSMMESLIEMEKQSPESMFVILSDVAVDNPKVLAGLKYLFNGYLQDNVIPTLIVLMGSFLSHPFGQHVEDMENLKNGFAKLGTIIKEEFQPLAEATTFVLVPSTTDIGPGNVLPRPPLPKFFTQAMIDTLGSDRVYSASNPCRIRYMSQEIVVLRDNILQKMVRHCSIKPDFSETGLICEHFVKSITDQCYLSPLPLIARPVLWAHQHALWLFPTPHVIITGDKVDGFICKYGGTLGLNPGSFQTDFSFLIYLPSERRAQQCSLNSEELEEEREEPENKSVHNDLGESPTADLEMEQVQDNDEPPDFNPDLVKATPSKKKESENPKEEDEEEEEEEEIVVEPNDITDEEEEDVTDEEKGHDDTASPIDDESDDDSLLVPAEGLKRIDVKALVRNALAEDTSTAGQTGGDDSDSESEKSQQDLEVDDNE